MSVQYVVPALEPGLFRIVSQGRPDFRFIIDTLGIYRILRPIAGPTATWEYECQNLVCLFDGSTSTNTLAWSWHAPNGMLLSTAPMFTRTFAQAGSDDVTLYVTGPTGLRDSLTRTIVVGGDPADTLPTPPPPPPSTGWREVFADGFESGNLTTAQGGYRWGSSNSGTNERPAVTTTRARSGTHALEFTFQGNRNLSDDAVSEQRFALGAQVQAVALDYWIFFPADYVHRDATGPDNNKLLRLWGGDRSDGNSGYSQYDVKLGYSTVLGFRVVAEKGVLEGNRRPGVNAFGGAWSGMPLGRWVHVRVEVTLGVSMDFFADGQLVMQRPAPAGPYLDYGYLMGWSNTGFDATTHVWIDDFRIEVR